MKRTNAYTSLLIILFFSSFTQAATMRQQGDWYAYWGWNNATYSDSDIHFKGEDHDFTLYNVSAHDHQTELSSREVYHSYLNPFLYIL